MAAGVGALARSYLAKATEGEVADADVMGGQVDIGTLSRAALILNLEKRGLSTEGSKVALRDRLVDWVTKKYDFDSADVATAQVQASRDAAKEESGSVYVCGVNHRGQLGLGDTEPREQFECVPALMGRAVDAVFAGPDFAMAVTEDRYVYAWGGGGQAALGTRQPQPQRATPARAPVLEGPAAAAETVRGWRERHAAAAAEQGVAPYSFSPRESLRRPASTDFLAPRIVDKLRGEGVVAVGIGVNHCIALSDGGDMFAWGTGRHGQLGTGKFDDAAEPELVESLASERVAAIALGHSHTVAVTADGVPFAWGRADQGCLGLGTTARLGAAGRYAALFPSPTALPSLAGRLAVRQVACGPTHTIALVSGDAPVWSWGDGSGGKLGHGDLAGRIEPEPIQSFLGEVVLQVAAGTWHSACIVEQSPFVGAGILYTWGTGLSGQLGVGSVSKALEPRPVYGFIDRGHSVKFVACGSHHNAALTHDSQLFTWGSNKYGCLGAEVVDEFAAYPQKVWAFDVIFDGVGRGTPRSVAVGREFTVVACFPYAGPSEQEVIEAEQAEALAAKAAAEASPPGSAASGMGGGLDLPWSRELRTRGSAVSFADETERPARDGHSPDSPGSAFSGIGVGGRMPGRSLFGSSRRDKACVRNLKMKVVAAYLLAVLGGNETPTEADVSKILAAAGAEADAEAVERLFKAVAEQDLSKVLDAGMKKLVKIGGGGAAAPAGGAAAAAAVEEEEEEEEEEESVAAGGMFGGSDDSSS
ncbi:hypothetical protein FNF27_01362 [Cafeteria roenbergensis]|uniref:SAP domain-containing protein n=1 Tax=Cafeteria roenbergensis TaxID=33653 RepID=A0A5A8EHK8_CAFRO|nr:hypothetical protein FNF27_01362 [Cafeteria roenbergensis]